MFSYWDILGSVGDLRTECDLNRQSYSLSLLGTASRHDWLLVRPDPVIDFKAISTYSYSTRYVPTDQLIKPVPLHRCRPCQGEITHCPEFP